ncbi:MAG: hypothetical protein DHS20C18_38880 [Saprospiraceae bacterium]|nr:MAG: hypothetical protein DHS20C18_38880 [Saprospiraceae bacterium]
MTAGQLIEDSKKFIQAEEWDKAVVALHEAIKIDPKNMVARISLIRAYHIQGLDLKALYLCGFTLQIANHPIHLCQLYNFMGAIAVEIAKFSNSKMHYDQALEFFEQSWQNNQDDVIPIYNLLETNIISSRQLENQQEIYLEKAKHYSQELIVMLEQKKGNAANYAPTVYKQATAIFPKDAFWEEKLLYIKGLSDKYL